MKFTIVDALHDTQKSFYINKADYETLQWNDDSAKPTLKDLEAKRDQIQADYDALQYQRDRAVAYPPLAEQMDILYHGGIDALKAELKKTKDKYPKP